MSGSEEETELERQLTDEQLENLNESVESSTGPIRDNDPPAPGDQVDDPWGLEDDDGGTESGSSSSDTRSTSNQSNSDSLASGSDTVDPAEETDGKEFSGGDSSPSEPRQTIGSDEDEASSGAEPNPSQPQETPESDQGSPSEPRQTIGSGGEDTSSGTEPEQGTPSNNGENTSPTDSTQTGQDSQTSPELVSGSNTVGEPKETDGVTYEGGSPDPQPESETPDGLDEADTPVESDDDAAIVDRSMSEYSDDDLSEIRDNISDDRSLYIIEQPESAQADETLVIAAESSEAATDLMEQNTEANIVNDTPYLDDRDDVSVEDGNVTLSDEGEQQRDEYVAQQYAQRVSEQTGADISAENVVLTGDGPELGIEGKRAIVAEQVDAQVQEDVSRDRIQYTSDGFEVQGRDELTPIVDSADDLRDNQVINQNVNVLTGATTPGDDTEIVVPQDDAIDAATEIGGTTERQREVNDELSERQRKEAFVQWSLQKGNTPDGVERSDVPDTQGEQFGTVSRSIEVDYSEVSVPSYFQEDWVRDQDTQQLDTSTVAEEFGEMPGRSGPTPGSDPGLQGQQTVAPTRKQIQLVQADPEDALQTQTSRLGQTFSQNVTAPVADVTGDVADIATQATKTTIAFVPGGESPSEAGQDYIDSVQDITRAPEDETDDSGTVEQITEKTATGAVDIAKTPITLPGTIVQAGETASGSAEFAAGEIQDDGLEGTQDSLEAAGGATAAYAARQAGYIASNPFKSAGALVGSAVIMGGAARLSPSAGATARGAIQPLEEAIGYGGNAALRTVSPTAARRLFPDNEPLVFSEEAAIRTAQRVGGGVQRAARGVRDRTVGDSPLIGSGSDGGIVGSIEPTASQQRLIERARPSGSPGIIQQETADIPDPDDLTQPTATEADTEATETETSVEQAETEQTVEEESTNSGDDDGLSPEIFGGVIEEGDPETPSAESETVSEQTTLDSESRSETDTAEAEMVEMQTTSNQEIDSAPAGATSEVGSDPVRTLDVTVESDVRDVQQPTPDQTATSSGTTQESSASTIETESDDGLDPEIFGGVIEEGEQASDTTPPLYDDVAEVATRGFEQESEAESGMSQEQVDEVMDMIPDNLREAVSDERGQAQLVGSGRRSVSTEQEQRQEESGPQDFQDFSQLEDARQSELRQRRELQQDIDTSTETEQRTERAQTTSIELESESRSPTTRAELNPDQQPATSQTPADDTEPTVDTGEQQDFGVEPMTEDDILNDMQTDLDQELGIEQEQEQVQELGIEQEQEQVTEQVQETETESEFARELESEFETETETESESEQETESEMWPSDDEDGQQDNLWGGAADETFETGFASAEEALGYDDSS